MPGESPVLATALAHFEAVTRNPVEEQRQMLRRILEENAGCEYLQGLGVGSGDDPEEFTSKVPLVTHKDIEHYIQRMVEGEGGSIITGKPIRAMSLSSGTTQGRPKYIPFNEELAQITMHVYRTSFALRNRDFPVGNGKALQFIYSSKESLTKGGLVATTATTNVYRSKHFQTTMHDIRSECTSPPEVIFGSDFHQSLYCHLLCGLIQSPQVSIVFSTFAHSIVHAFRALENLWEDICDDIERGELSFSRVSSPSMRAAVHNSAFPNGPEPVLADSIRAKIRGLSNWYGVIPALWPNAKYVYGIMTGSMEPYIKKLRHYAGGLPLVSADYGASEGWVGVNARPYNPPEETVYAVMPDVAYFEFIPLRKLVQSGGVDADDDSAGSGYLELEPVGIGEVQLGQEYELVVTTVMGFYRYRMGDVVRVEGFYNATPELRFVRRRSLILSVNIDKNTECDLQVAVEEAAKLAAAEKLEVVDFTSYADRSCDPGRYVIYWELNGTGGGAEAAMVDAELLSSCADALDRGFADVGYVGSRKSGGISPLELRVVRRGTFHKVMEHYLGMGGAVSQFKTPRCIAAGNIRVLQVLNENIVGRYFSAAYD